MLLSLLPGAVDMLNFLKSRQVKLAIVSNAREERFKRQLEHFQLQDYFEVIVTSFEAGGEKSSLKPFKLFLEKANKIQPIAAKECIMVWDRPDEDAHAKKLGFFTILFNPRKNAEKEVTPNLTVTNHDELLRFFTTIF